MVANYLQTCDFLVFISEASFKKLIRDEDCKVINAQTMAYGYISEKLSGRYQIAKELSKEGENRNAAMVRVSSFVSNMVPGSSPAPMHSSSSSSTSGSAPLPRFWAVRLRQREKARFRVILAKNIRSTDGLLGGMVCQAFK